MLQNIVSDSDNFIGRLKQAIHLSVTIVGSDIFQLTKPLGNAISNTQYITAAHLHIGLESYSKTFPFDNARRRSHRLPRS